MDVSDPFRHHPGLRALIGDASASFFRDLDVDALKAQMAANGFDDDFYPEEVREAERRAFLADHGPGDLWVFAYGSLMWDPALVFSEVRRATAPGWARRFILKDTFGARGSRERPGLMVALDAAHGAACDGLVFRIDASIADAESYVLWRRERIGPAYDCASIVAETAQGPVRAVTFVADHEAEVIVAGLGFEEQVEYCATGAGLLGTSLDYLRNIARHLAEFRIEDAELIRLHHAAEARAAALAAALAADKGPE